MSETLSYGDPDPKGEGGYYYYTNAGSQIYETGMVLMAIASTGSPNEFVTVSPTNPAYDDVNGKTYKQVAEGVVRYFAWAQNESGGGRGGWRYQPNYGDSDNSNAQWPVIGMQSSRLVAAMLECENLIFAVLAMWKSKYHLGSI